MPENVYSAFSSTAATHAGRPFLHIPRQATQAYSDEVINLGYQAAAEAVTALIPIYRDAGYTTGTRVALLLDNRAEFFLHFLALNALGASVVPINSALTTTEMAYVIGHSNTGLVVSLGVHIEKAGQAVARLERPPPVVDLNGLQALPAARGQTPGAVVDEAALLYTSGTTGTPKACMLSNAYFLALGRWYNNAGGYCRLNPGMERLITPLPLVHMNALCTSMMAMILSGGCIIQLDRFHASSWWETVRESAATCFHYLGVMPAILLKQPASAQDNHGEQLKFGFGAGVDPTHHAAFEARFGVPLIEAWSMTEVGAAAIISAHTEPRHVGSRCFGRPVAGMEYRIIDESATDVAPGLAGELLVRAKGEDPRKDFFSGYYRDEEATQDAWQGGWFHTGDVVRVDASGQFYFVDRRKNIIRRSGENIAAVEVEGILLQCPLVRNCAVAAVEDEIRGEEVAACIILEDDIPWTVETAGRVFDYCYQQSSYYKVPGWYIFLKNLPMTGSQKLQRGEIKSLCKDAIASGTGFDLRERKRNRN